MNLNMKTIKSVFLLFLGVLLLTTAVATVTQTAAAQCNPAQQSCCPDPNNPNGKPIACPPADPNEPVRRKKTPTPQPRRRTPTPTFTASPTATPTLVPTSSPQPYPYPYPYPGGIIALTPPAPICLFCDRPWLWGVGTGILFLIGLGFLIGLLRPLRLGRGGIIAPTDLPAGNENYTMTVRDVNGDGELVPAVQRGINENMTIGGDVNGAGELLPAVQRAREAALGPDAAHVKLDPNPDNAFIKGEGLDPGDAFHK